MTSRRSGLHITRALSAGVTALLNGTHLMSCVHLPAGPFVRRQASVVSSTYCRGSVPFNADFSISEDRLSDVDDDIESMSYVTPCKGGRDTVCGTEEETVVFGREERAVDCGMLGGDVISGWEEGGVQGQTSLESSEKCVAVNSTAVDSVVCEEERLKSGTEEAASCTDNSNLTSTRSLCQSAPNKPQSSSTINNTADKDQTCTKMQSFKKHDSFNLSDIETSLILSTTASARFRRTSSRFALSSTPIGIESNGPDKNRFNSGRHCAQSGDEVSDIDSEEEREQDNRQAEEDSIATSYDDADYIDFLWENLEQMTNGLLNRTIVNDIVNEALPPPPSEWRDNYYAGLEDASSQPIDSRDFCFGDETIPPPSGWEDTCVVCDEQESTPYKDPTHELPCYLSICSENYQISGRIDAMIEGEEKSPPTYFEMMNGRQMCAETDGYCKPPHASDTHFVPPHADDISCVPPLTGDTHCAPPHAGDISPAPPCTGYAQIAEYFAFHRRVAIAQTDGHRESVGNTEDAHIPEDPEFDVKVASTDDDISDTESNTSSESSFEYASRLYKMTGGEWNNRVFPCDATLV